MRKSFKNLKKNTFSIILSMGKQRSTDWLVHWLNCSSLQITLMSAVRKYLGSAATAPGKVFVTSGLGGMSGAQARAAVIVGVVGVIAEVWGFCVFWFCLLSD